MTSIRHKAMLITVAGLSSFFGNVASQNSICTDIFTLKQGFVLSSLCILPVASFSIVWRPQILQQEMYECQWNKFVLVTQFGVSVNSLDYIRSIFTSGSLSSSLNYEVAMTSMETSAISTTIWNAYYKNRIFNFIWITRHPKEVIETAHNLFHEKSRSQGALMTNQIKFIVVTFSPDITEIAADTELSLFDNLALFVFNEDPVSLDKVYTHMWRNNRTREFQDIPAPSMRDTGSCTIFPNTINGFNGRHFYGLAKEWLPEFYKTENKLTGKKEYSGFYIDMFDVLASTLNFTYTLVPSADTEDNMTWEAYANIVSSCHVDFGINLYTNNAIFKYNISTSFPVLYSSYVGVYINRSKPDPYRIFMVFKVKTYLIIVTCTLAVVLLYLMLTHLPCQCGDCLFLPTRKMHGRIPQNQTHQVHPPRSSVFEVDWQSKYKFLETPQISSACIRITGNDERNHSHQDDIYFKRKPVYRWIHQLKKFSYSKLSIRLEKIKDVSRYFTNIYINNPKKTKIKSKIINNIRNKEKGLSIQESTRRNDIRSSIYNNSSHYVTEYVSKGCYISCKYQTRSRIVPVRFNIENVSSQHTSKAEDNDLIEMLSSKLQYIFDVLFGFFGTLVNQGLLPEADRWAPRILLAAWSYMMIVLVATYTGNLTATFADTKVEIPIKSFDELSSREDYRWGTVNETLMYTLLKLSGRGTTLRKLYEGINRFSKSDPSVLGSLDDLIMHLKAEKFVALISNFTYEYLEDYTDLPGLTQIPEVLLIANGGFVFPVDSELNQAISNQIIAMRDSGITNGIFQRLRIRVNVTMKAPVDDSNLYLNMDNVAGVFYVSGFGILIALVTLMVEIFIPKLRTEIRT